MVALYQAGLMDFGQLWVRHQACLRITACRGGRSLGQADMLLAKREHLVTNADSPIFHITHLDNLASIVAAGGLWSDSERIAQNIGVQNIGNLRIKNRRLTRVVSVAAGGMLGDYVPFNFCPRSVMLYVVGQGHDDYGGGQKDILHLRSNTQTVSGSSWAFTERHAELPYAEYFGSLGDLDKLHWPSINEHYWSDPDVRERKQAEFLIHRFCPWALIVEIGVRSQTTADKVLEALRSAAHLPQVSVRPSWYY